MLFVEQQCRVQYAKTHAFLPVLSTGCSQAGAGIAGSAGERHRDGAPLLSGKERFAAAGRAPWRGREPSDHLAGHCS